MIEIADIPGYEGRYAVTSDGMVWSYPKRCSPCGRWLRTLNSNGYAFVNLGFSNPHPIHRLVAYAHLEQQPGRNHINHLNGDKLDNRAENLEWCTQAENNRHAWATSLVQPARRVRLELVPEILARAAKGETQQTLANEFCVGRSTIQRVLYGTHGYGQSA